METLKKIQSKTNNSISQINISIKSLVSRVEQGQNRLTGTEDKVE
jgi:hypothetical protein